MTKKKNNAALYLIDGFTGAQVALRYYAKTQPGKYPDKEQARKQFAQDSHIETSPLLEVIKELYREQTARIKELGKK